MTFIVGLTHLLCLEDTLNSSECIEIVTYLSTSREHVLLWECKHLSYIVKKSDVPGSGVATTLSCDLSNFSWKFLLQKQDLDYETVKAICSLGGKFALEDIENITKNVSGRNISVLQLAMLKSKDYVKMFLEAVGFSKFKQAEDYLKESQLNIDDLSLSSVLQIMLQRKIHTAKRRDYISFIGKLLDEYGISPNQQKDEELCPLDVALKLPSKEYQAERIALLTLLIEHGAAIESCTYPEKNQTTLLHIATKLAIESGN